MSRARNEHGSMFVRLASRVCRRLSFASLLCSLVAAASIAEAQLTTIDFDRYPGGDGTTDGDIITTQYTSRGVVFDNSAQLGTLNTPLFQGRSAFVLNGASELTLTFTTPVTIVRLDATDTDGRGVLTAFDSNDQVVDTDTIEPTTTGGDSYEVSGAGIASVRFVAGYGSPDSFWVDNVAFGDDDFDNDGLFDEADDCIGDNATGDADDDGVCNDRDDRVLVLTESFVQPRGPCSQGGVEIIVGVDRDASETLSEVERWGSSDVCNGPEGRQGLQVRFKTAVIEPANNRCPSGGVELKLGIDENRNNVLDEITIGSPVQDNEVDVTHDICNGMWTVSAVWPTLSTKTCPNGGVEIAIGLDDNGNGWLDELGLADSQSISEVDASQYICNGSDSLIRLTPVFWLPPLDTEPDPLADCPTGGLRVEAGTDWNGSGELEEDEGEVAVDEAICHGLNTVIVTSEISEGDEVCESGGFRVRGGADSNNDGNVSPEEQTMSQSLCHGHDALTSIATLDPDPEGCVFGGVEFAAGTDENGDGELAMLERAFTRALCHGLGALVEVSTLDVNTEQCPQGGVRIDTGVDADADGELYEKEIRFSETVCNGLDSLVKTEVLEPDAALCRSGGLLLLLGTDRDADATLDAEEIETQFELCHGDGSVAWVSPVAPGASGCLRGGARLDTGPDVDADGMLDQAEIDNTQTFCAGLSTLSRTSTVAPNPSQCVTGGVKLEFGVDNDGDEVLDDSEVKSMEIVCGGSGLAVRMSELEPGSAECPIGGTLLETGVDTDGDGELSEDEVQNSDPLCQPAELLFEADAVPEGDDRCSHGGLRIRSGLDDGDPNGTPGNGELEDAEIELDRKVCLAPTEELVVGDTGQCSVTAPGASGRGSALPLVLLLGLASVIVRSRKRPRSR